MTLHDLSCTIDALSESTRTDDTWILSEAHIASLGREFFLVVHDVDDIVLAFWSELFTRCISDTEDIASILDCHDLRTETDSEVWDFVLSRITGCCYHTLGSTSSESSRDTDTMESFEEFCSL